LWGVYWPREAEVRWELAPEGVQWTRDLLLAELRQEVKDERVLWAISQVPRERFVPPELASHAYENRPLPIGHGQTISQPLIVAIMTSALALRGQERVLEVGTGSGYQAALLSLLAREVVSVERVPELAHKAAQRLRELGYHNVRVYVARPDVLGWPDEAPYDAIIVTAAAPRVPQSLLDQLAPGGRMVIPVGGRDLQELVLVEKVKKGWKRRDLGPCRFVPLIGPEAWPPEEAYKGEG
jgi:protein-L-isoaspartate(D-aspartate) O-methyltransferase